MNSEQIKKRIMEIFVQNPGVILDFHDIFDLMWRHGRKYFQDRRQFRPLVHDSLFDLAYTGKIKHYQETCSGGSLRQYLSLQLFCYAGYY